MNTLVVTMNARVVNLLSIRNAVIIIIFTLNEHSGRLIRY